MPSPAGLAKSQTMTSHTEYLVQQGVPGLLNDLVESIVAAKPTDALSYACKYLDNKRNMQLVGHNMFDLTNTNSQGALKTLNTLVGMGSPSSSRFPTSVYGKHVFKGVVAEEFLRAQGLTSADLDDPSWTKTKADQVAAAVLEWGKANGADVFTHWFQPLGGAGLRPGATGQVHNSVYCFNRDGSMGVDFDGKALVKGETDGSSYPNGGLRATHTAGGYTIIDPSSPIFIRGDTVHIPACFVTWHGHSIDEKTPLLRAQQALSKEGIRLMKLLGWDIKGLQANIGLEQEFFLVPREAYYKRPDLQLTGRTVLGYFPPRGQELCDHYMGAFNQLALECMKDIQNALYAIGIPMRTRHREVAPNQYECAPLFGVAQTQIDQNLMVMQLIEEIAAQHNLAALFQEKPFSGINGSGKHNNWSLGDPNGINLFNPKQVTAASGKTEIFPIVMSAVVRAVDKHGDMMRMAIASPGNDFRLGACEAPPAIMSTYLGEDMTSYLEEFKKGTVKPYEPKVKTMSCGVDMIGDFTVPAEDRNRTSPFPYGGNRFEFRAVGSSQNVSLVNTVLCTMMADSFKAFADEIEGGATATTVAAKALDAHWRCIFNGNGYGESWPAEATSRGLWKIDSGVEAIACLENTKNTQLFDTLKVMSTPETLARAEVMFNQYTGTVEMEAKCMIDMIRQHIVPSVKKSIARAGAPPTGCPGVADLESCVAKLEASLHHVESEGNLKAKAALARVLRLETMDECRKVCDAVEARLPAEFWTLATYKELLFLDSNQSAKC
uniref:GS catalytic domain-containing protein n=1 Tax=Eutreptiella gymnastica TaxID=73025 RepID=A0A7S1N4S4_9EUGL|mmetsp:Transcript_118544/g.206394  ORF Transcript_118544/g.206394 Transcript_118544/m.206394 type:complete len:777 (+) Transcript_118544:104-2434(+)